MRTPNGSTVGYQPGDAPADPSQLQRFLREELLRIKAAFDILAAGHLDKSYVAPLKPREGDIRFADGLQWKPNGVGEAGIWYFDGTDWRKLG